jgi:hypothetical protein
MAIDFHHAIHMEVYNGRLAMAPIDDMPLHNVLDIGTGVFRHSRSRSPIYTPENTGTGVWAVEFGKLLSSVPPHLNVERASY